MASTQRQIQPVFQAASRFEAFDVSVKSQPPQLGRLQGKTNSCLKKKKKKASGICCSREKNPRPLRCQNPKLLEQVQFKMCACLNC